MCYLEGMNKFEEKRAERRKIILTEAKKLVLERGIYDGAMSELAVRAGISRQQLYNYYKNLDEVLSGIMEELVAHSYLARIADAAEVDTPENLIRYAILAFKDLSPEVHEDLLFMNLYSVHLATAPSVHAERRPARILLFERQIVRGQETGIFRSDKPLEELTATVSVLLAGYTFHCETLSEGARARMLGEEMLHRLADMVLAYLKGSPTPAV